MKVFLSCSRLKIESLFFFQKVKMITVKLGIECDEFVLIKGLMAKALIVHMFIFRLQCISKKVETSATSKGKTMMINTSSLDIPTNLSSSFNNLTPLMMSPMTPVITKSSGDIGIKKEQNNFHFPHRNQ